MACRNCYRYPLCEKCNGPQGTCERVINFDRGDFKSRLKMRTDEIPKDNTIDWNSSEVGEIKIYWKKRGK